jgi:hypothetical protein
MRGKSNRLAFEHDAPKQTLDVALEKTIGGVLINTHRFQSLPILPTAF